MLMAAQPAPLTPTRGKHKCDWRQVDEAVVVKVSWEHNERLMGNRWNGEKMAAASGLSD